MDSLEKIANEIKRCKKCRLWRNRKNAVPGEGPRNAKIIFVGESPGKNEDEVGRPFVGMSGKFFTKKLSELGMDRKKFFICGIIRCHPPKNRNPKKDEILKCLPYLERQISVIKPKIICLLGNVSTKAVLGNEYSVSKNHGKLIVKNKKKFFIMPHPAAAMRFPKFREIFTNDLKKLKSLMKNA